MMHHIRYHHSASRPIPPREPSQPNVPLVLIWPADEDFQELWDRRPREEQLSLINEAMIAAAQAKATKETQFLTAWLDYEGRDGAQSLHFYVQPPIMYYPSINQVDPIHACEINIECGIIGA